MIFLNKSQSFSANSTGGEYTHTLTVAEMPSHKHQNGTGVGYAGGLDTGFSI